MPHPPVGRVPDARFRPPVRRCRAADEVGQQHAIDEMRYAPGERDIVGFAIDTPSFSSAFSYREARDRTPARSRGLQQAWIDSAGAAVRRSMTNAQRLVRADLTGQCRKTCLDRLERDPAVAPEEFTVCVTRLDSRSLHRHNDEGQARTIPRHRLGMPLWIWEHIEWVPIASVSGATMTSAASCGEQCDEGFIASQIGAA